MADKRIGGAPPKWSSRETTPGVKIDSGPFIGIIKNNADPARLGRLQVWIPDLGGDENTPSNWYTVNYASPFFGSTIGLPGAEDGYGQQTYGFWAVPPDLKNFVLVTFVMGDPSRGYWFACVPNTQTQLMVPAVGRPKNNDKLKISEAFGKNRGIPDTTVYLPAAEPNLETKERDLDPNYLTSVRDVLDFQAEIVLQQGLETDPIRGTVTSSAQRDMPSSVVGLSSPGRANPDTTDFPREALDELIKKGKSGLDIKTLQGFPFRKGGHTFVMDDGDIYGDNRLLRLRSSGGHQIVMHDTTDIMYISNSRGNVWLEFTQEGSINVYGASSINLRAEKDLNLHAGGNVNVHAGNTIKMYGDKYILSETQQQRVTATTSYSINAGNVGVTSASTLLMKSVTGGWKCSGELMLKGSKIYMNTAGKVPEDPQKNEQFEFYKQDDVTYDTGKKRWFKAAGAFQSIAPITPTHEPWTRQTGVLKKNDGSTQNSQPQTPKT